MEEFEPSWPSIKIKSTNKTGARNSRAPQQIVKAFFALYNAANALPVQAEDDDPCQESDTGEEKSEEEIKWPSTIVSASLAVLVRAAWCMNDVFVEYIEVLETSIEKCAESEITFQKDAEDDLQDMIHELQEVQSIWEELCDVFEGAYGSEDDREDFLGQFEEQTIVVQDIFFPGTRLHVR